MKFTTRLVKQILLAMLCSLGLTILTTLLILWPRSRNEIIAEMSAVNNEIVNQISVQSVAMIDSAHQIVSSADIHRHLMIYYENPIGRSYHGVRLFLNREINELNNVRGAVLESYRGIRFDSIVSLSSMDLDVLYSERYSQIRNTFFSSGFSKLYSINYEDLTIAYSLNRFIGAENHTLTVFFDVTPLIRSIYALSFGVFERYLVFDFEGKLLFYVGDGYSGNSDTLSYFFEHHDSVEYFSNSGGHYFVNRIASSEWIAVGHISRSNFNNAFIQQSVSILMLFLLMSALTIVLTVPITYRALRPIKELSTIMETVSLEDLNIRSEITTNDEIGRLSDIFNNMIESLQKNIDDKLAYEVAEQRMKYNLLIAQFDSHFVYNTISTISAFARKGRTDEIVVLNTALVQLMQNFLRVKTYDITDTIEHEIEMVRQYWIIVNMRYENHVNLIIDLPEELKTELIPKNLIQPLVENSLFHGLVDEESGEMHGEINVIVRKKEDAIVITVTDNGKGIEPIKLAILNDSDLAEGIAKGKRGRHIGLHNIRQRLEHIYKQSGYMQIESSKGTTITLVLPLHKEPMSH